MSETIFTNANIVLPDRIINGSVSIRDDRIISVDEGEATKGKIINCEGDYLIPGLIELHTDNLERHVQPRPKSFWPTQSAIINHDREIASAGITTVFDSLCVGIDQVDVRASQVVRDMVDGIMELEKDQTLKIDHKIHWRCEVSNARMQEQLEPLANHPKTGLFSVMDHTPGQRQFVSLEAFYTYQKGKFGMSDAELEEMIAKRKVQREAHSSDNRKIVVEHAASMNVPLASHDDATLEHVDEAIADGMVVAEFPTTVEAAAASHKNGMAVLMGAPNVVRGQSHSGNVSARELGDRNILDILSSDYLPSSLLYGAYMLAQACKNMDLPKAIATVTYNPAKKVGLDDRGSIRAGNLADLVRFRAEHNIPNIVEVWKRGGRIA